LIFWSTSISQITILAEKPSMHLTYSRIKINRKQLIGAKTSSKKEEKEIAVKGEN